MILELDESYLRETWLPNLTRTYLNAGGNELRNVRVVSNSTPALTFFETRADASASQPDKRFLLLTQGDSDTPELIQNDNAGAIK